MIEMVMVLIVMAIIASFVLFRTATSRDELIAETEILKSHLRYAQIKAMNDTDVNVPRGWGIHVPNNSSYVLYRDNAKASDEDILPGEVKTEDPPKDAQTHTLPSGVTVSTDCVNATCNFNEWGSPGATTFTMTLMQGTSTSNISITKNTGFVN